ncbi:MAG TPA: putative glycolipid-binding domain-containing protein [Longimicrobium sp.]|nr:putative glycolipid-binding domain-containing protein [Longimicrobium sp.]
MAEGMVLWRRVDQPGHEAARVVRDGDRWRLEGTAVFAHEGRPCRLDYRLVCEDDWRFVHGRVSGWMGGREVAHEVQVDGSGCWWLDGEEVAEVEGCVDFDLNFSPSTNLLPIRRLGLDVGEEAEASAAWLRFPSFQLERLDQVYRRTGPAAYRYETTDGAFARDLDVDEAGLVTRYPEQWEAERVA